MKKVILIILILGAVFAAGWYWLQSRAEPTPVEAAAPIAQVEGVPLERGRLTQTVTAFGLVAPTSAGEQSISATYETVVRRVQVTAGARVAAGDLLMEIEPSPDGQVALKSARSALTLAGEARAAMQQRFDLKLATRQDLLAAQQAETEAQLRWDSLRSRGLAGDGRVVAANAGVVSRVDASAGALVPAGGVLLTMTMAAHHEVRLGVELTDLAQIAPGQTVTLLPVNRTDAEPVVAKVASVDGTVDPATGAATVRAALPDEAAFLMGEHVQARIAVKQSEGWKVPRQALLPEGAKQILFTVRDGHAVRHEVAVGIEADGFVEVRGDQLTAGDAVVTQGNYELEDGMAVQMTEAVK